MAASSAIGRRLWLGGCRLRTSRTLRIAMAATETVPRPIAGKQHAQLPQGRPAVMAALGAIWLVWLYGTLMPSNWVWDVDVLASWPVWAAVFLLALGVVGFIPAVSRWAGQQLTAAALPWQRARWRGDGLVAAGIGTALFVLRDHVRFTGDFGLRVGLLGMDNPGPQLRRLMWPAEEVVNYYVPRRLVAAGWSPEFALQLVGAVLGALITHFAGDDKFGPLSAKTPTATGVLPPRTSPVAPPWARPSTPRCAACRWQSRSICKGFAKTGSESQRPGIAP